MEERKWEDICTDCLENIFGRLGVKSLLLNVPLVCKPWYQATLSPSCWQRLIFSFEIFESRIAAAYTFDGRFTTEGRIRFLGKPNELELARSATLLVLPVDCTREQLIFVSNQCPALKYLALPANVVYYNDFIIPELISKWESLEILRLDSSTNLVEIIKKISQYCKKFAGLGITRTDSTTKEGACITKDKASKIVTSLPNIKCMILKNLTLDKENLEIILKGCKELVQLEVRHCIGFDEYDKGIRKLASQINNFCCKGSKPKD